jgi:hypothetical protein
MLFAPRRPCAASGWVRNLANKKINVENNLYPYREIRFQGSASK